jgi:ATP phosphoribosyltransferase
VETTSLRIAIQKSGRLTDKTIHLLENIGLKFDGYKDRLLVRSLNFDVELLLIRDDDIPEYVQDGICDLGIVGANVSLEKGADVEVIRDLQYGMCRLSVAVPNRPDSIPCRTLMINVSQPVIRILPGNTSAAGVLI